MNTTQAMSKLLRDSAVNEVQELAEAGQLNERSLSLKMFNPGLPPGCREDFRAMTGADDAAFDAAYNEVYGQHWDL